MIVFSFEAWLHGRKYRLFRSWYSKAPTVSPWRLRSLSSVASHDTPLAS